MKNNALIKRDNEVLRILDIQGTKAFVIDCRKKSRPKWVDMAVLSSYADYTDNDFILKDINNIDMASRKIAYERFAVISSILPFITDNEKRCSAIAYISAEKGISKQTINNYLWFYLAYQNITALAPKTKDTTKELTADEKNIRWALNKYFYTQRKYSLNTVYSLLLKEKYCDNFGRLIEPYPTFNQFRYFYRKHKKMQNYYISRDGLKNYQRNNRPLLGNGVQEFACNIGVGMLDSTVCDIYLVNDSGGIVGRPILTACIDGFSGLCCGYSLSWEGGVYSLRSLMLNVIADKKEWCRRFGIDIKNEDWACNSLPATLVTDMGREYASDTFSQISDLGVTIVNLPPYRPELKGTVEKFFDIVQNLYKPHLKGKGVIETDYQERGTHDYRRDALTVLKDVVNLNPDTVITVSGTINHYNKHYDCLAVANNHCRYVNIDFYLKENKGLCPVKERNFFYSRTIEEDIPFTKEAITKCVECYLNWRSMEMVSFRKRNEYIMKPSITHSSEELNWCSADNMIISIPYELIGIELCEDLENWGDCKMMAALNKNTRCIDLTHSIISYDDDDWAYNRYKDRPLPDDCEDEDELF